MCTYDYTPYTGCTDGQQHYFIQWVKCGVAAENGRYCSVNVSTRAEHLRQLSANVLSCPLHGPIAVQQFVLDSANARQQQEEEAEKPRARSTTRQGAAPRGRTPKRDSDRDSEQPARREVRKQRSRREMAPESSDSESSSSLASRRRASGRVRRSANGERAERRTRTVQAGSHRRSTSADIARHHQPPPLSMRHGRSEVSLPLRAGLEAQEDLPPVPGTTSRPTRPTTSLDIPRAIGVVGLPSSPDMHRRGSVHKTRSESLLRNNQEQADALPAPRSAVSPASDSSPDQNPDLPFSSPGRRGRRTARSIRDRSVDTTMRRIDEHIVSGDHDATIGLARGVPTPETRSINTTSPEPQHRGPPAHQHRRANSASKPLLNNLQIPKTSAAHLRDAYSAPTATPPESDITESKSAGGFQPPRGRAKSLRNVDMSSPVAPHFPFNLALPGASSSSSNLPSSSSGAVAGRESVDSGYLSSHGHGHGHYTTQQRSWERVGSVDSGLGIGVGIAPGGGSGNGNGKTARLQKTPPSSSSSSRGQGQQSHPQTQPQTQNQEGQQPRQKPTPAPLNLNTNPTPTANPNPALNPGSTMGGRLPPCALPISLFSPTANGFQSPLSSDADVSPGGGKSSRVTLLQRMGLKRKISGLWERGGGPGAAQGQSVGFGG